MECAPGASVAVNKHFFVLRERIRADPPEDASKTSWSFPSFTTLHSSIPNKRLFNVAERSSAVFESHSHSYGTVVIEALPILIIMTLESPHVMISLSTLEDEPEVVP